MKAATSAVIFPSANRVCGRFQPHPAHRPLMPDTRGEAFDVEAEPFECSISRRMNVVLVIG
jgi:hypothetical protein